MPFRLAPSGDGENVAAPFRRDLTGGLLAVHSERGGSGLGPAVRPPFSTMRPMARTARRGAPRIVVIMSLAVAAVLVFVAITLVLVTGADVSKVESNQSVVAGPESGLRSQIDALGAVYYANPLGGDGFWLTLRDGELVALRLQQRLGEDACELEFDRDTKTFTVCDTATTADGLATLPLTIEDGKVSVDIRADTD